jgi:ligand-binding sensor domain-containing protein
MTRAGAARTRPRAALGVAAAAVLAVHACVALEAHALQARLWTPDERTLVTDGGRIAALAVSRTQVLAATPDAILVYDVARRAWQAPILMPGPRPSPFTALGVDPVSGEVWVGTSTGELLRGMPGFGTWEGLAAPVRGAIERIAPYPPESATFVLAGGEWWKIEWASSFASEVSAGSVPAAVREEAGRGPDDPFLAAARNSLGLDPQMRRWTITAIARGIEPDEFWIGTDGGGMVRFQSRRNDREWLRFGLVSRGAASVARFGDGLWFGGDGRGRYNGIAAASPDLGAWRQHDASQGAPAGFVAEMATDGRRIWFAADGGLFRLDPDDAGRPWSRFTAADGLPSDRVRSVLHEAGRIWVGTDRGLVAFDTAGRVAAGPYLAGRRVARTALVRDTLWIASDDGLRTLVLPRTAAVRDAGAPAVPSGVPAAVARGRARDVVAGAGVWALTDAGLFRLDGGGPRGPVRDAAIQRIGPPVRLTVADGRLWVAAPQGVAHLDPVTGAWEVFTVPADIPAGPILDVLPDGDDVWIAIPAGALRLRWR